MKRSTIFVVILLMATLVAAQEEPTPPPTVVLSNVIGFLYPTAIFTLETPDVGAPTITRAGR